MPVVFRYKRFKFFFYSNEGMEFAHIHVRSGDGEAKFWLNPVVRLARNDGYDARTLKELAGIVEVNRNQLLEAWHEYFG